MGTIDLKQLVNKNKEFSNQRVLRGARHHWTAPQHQIAVNTVGSVELLTGDCAEVNNIWRSFLRQSWGRKMLVLVRQKFKYMKRKGVTVKRKQIVVVAVNDGADYEPGDRVQLSTLTKKGRVKDLKEWRVHDCLPWSKRSMKIVHGRCSKNKLRLFYQ